MLDRWRNLETRARMDRIFHVPMLLLAFLILPLLALELFGHLPPTGHLLVEVGFWVIWLAFLTEFSIKISIAESRWQYARRNWLDIVVILLPLLRPLRVLRMARGLQVGRSLRLLSMRAVGQKAILAIVFMIAEYRALGKGTRPHEKEPQSALVCGPPLAVVQEKLASLERRVSALEEKVEEVAANGHDALAEADKSRSPKASS